MEAMRKKPPAQWISDQPFFDDAENKCSKAGKHQQQTQSTSMFKCGWSLEHNLAYRVKQLGDAKDFALPIAREDMKDLKAKDSVIATWGDGTKEPISDMTKEKLLSIFDSRSGSSSSTGAILEIESELTHNRIHLQQRTDRKLHLFL